MKIEERIAREHVIEDAKQTIEQAMVERALVGWCEDFLRAREIDGADPARTFTEEPGSTVTIARKLGLIEVDGAGGIVVTNNGWLAAGKAVARQHP